MVPIHNYPTLTPTAQNSAKYKKNSAGASGHLDGLPLPLGRVQPVQHVIHHNINSVKETQS